MTTVQAPTPPAIPSAGDLANLDPGVAYAFLAVVALAMVLFYFGGALKDRLVRKDPPRHAAQPAPDPAATGPVPAVLPSPQQVLARTDAYTDKLIARLEAEIEARDARIDDLERENKRYSRDLEQAREELSRAQWRRGV